MYPQNLVLLENKSVRAWLFPTQGMSIIGSSYAEHGFPEVEKILPHFPWCCPFGENSFDSQAEGRLEVSKLKSSEILLILKVARKSETWNQQHQKKWNCCLRPHTFTLAVPSMWFWSVSWSTNCPVYFSLFLVDQKKKLSSLREFLFTLLKFLSSLF